MEFFTANCKSFSDLKLLSWLNDRDVPIQNQKCFKSLILNKKPPPAKILEENCFQRKNLIQPQLFTLKIFQKKGMTSFRSSTSFHLSLTFSLSLSLSHSYTHFHTCMHRQAPQAFRKSLAIPQILFPHLPNPLTLKNTLLP